MNNIQEVVTRKPANGFVEYVNSVKPYHTKILDTSIEYVHTDSIGVTVTGHVHIEDDLGTVLLDQNNAIHPQNMARVIARALSNESNFFVNRIAFGDGGSVTDGSYTISIRPPNDGQVPDINTWDSRIYHEIYSEIVDDSYPNLTPRNIGVDPGSADLNAGIRAGGAAVPSNDPLTIANVSGPGVKSIDKGLSSQVIVYCVINDLEPTFQTLTGGTFTFDEIGLYTSGAPAIKTNGYQLINVGNKTSLDDTGLNPNTTYSLNIAVNGGGPITITFTTPGSGSGNSGEILYGDLCEAFNTGDPSWGFAGVNPLPGNTTVSITDTTNGTFSTIIGANTNGFLKFTSSITGSSSLILLDDPSWNSHFTVDSFLYNINPPNKGTLELPSPGLNAGIQNAPTNPTAERERLLTHITFTPVTKEANRSLIITYTLTVSVARST